MAIDRYLTKCVQCGQTTSRKYAGDNNGKCKSCVHPEQARLIAAQRAERHHRS